MAKDTRNSIERQNHWPHALTAGSLRAFTRRLAFTQRRLLGVLGVLLQTAQGTRGAPQWRQLNKVHKISKRKRAPRSFVAIAYRRRSNTHQSPATSAHLECCFGIASELELLRSFFGAASFAAFAMSADTHRRVPVTILPKQVGNQITLLERSRWLVAGH